MTPYDVLELLLQRLPIAATLDMSTSIALVTCAEVSSERRMCSAMPRRMADMASTDSPSWGAATGVATGAGAGAGASGAAVGVGAGSSMGASVGGAAPPA